MYLEEVQCHMHPHTDIYFVRDVKNTRIKYTLEAKLIFRNTSFELTKAANAHLPKTIVDYILCAYDKLM